MDVQEQINKFKDFFEVYYFDGIFQQIKKGSFVAKVDFIKLAEFEPKLTDLLIEQPEDTIRAAEIALEGIDFSSEEEKKIDVRFYNLNKDQVFKIKNIRSKHIGKLIQIKGTISRFGEIKHIPTLKVFECPACANRITGIRLNNELKEPKSCSCGRKGKFREVRKEVVDVQKIVIEDDWKIADATETIAKIVVELKGELANPQITSQLKSSYKVEITGIVKEILVDEKKDEYMTYIEANNIEFKGDELHSIKLPKERISELSKRIKEDTNLINNLSHSLAPKIHGLLSLKQSIILSLIGANNFYENGRLVERGKIHIMFISSPGKGKTLILNRINEIVPGSRFSIGSTASGIGLVASVQKDELLGGGWTLMPGAIPLSNNNFCIYEDAELLTTKGLMRISEIKSKDKVISYNENKVYFNEVKKVIDNGFKKTVRINTFFGKEIICTPDHKILTQKGWVEAQKLKRNDFIKTPIKDIDFKKINKKSIDFKKGFLAGFIACDVHKTQFSASIKNKERSAYVLNLLRDVFPNIKIIKRDLNKSNRMISGKVRKFSKCENFVMSGSLEFIRFVRRTFNCDFDDLNDNFIIGFLSAILSTDCSISCKNSTKDGKKYIKGEISISLHRANDVTEKLMNFTQNLMNLLGVMCVRRVNMLKINSNKSFNLTVNIFKDYVVGVKREKLININQKTKISSYDDRCDNSVVNWLKKIKFDTSQTVKLGLHSSIWSAIQNNSVTCKLLDKLRNNWEEVSKDSFIDHNKNYLLNKVLCVSDFEEKRVYDLSLDDDHNFFISGGLVHNCVLDELDKVSAEDMGLLNQALDKLEVTVDKATVHKTLASNTCVIAAANPKHRVFDPNVPVWNQINNINKDLIDRFDLKFIIPEINKEEQPKIIDKIFKRFGSESDEEKEEKIIYSETDIRDLMIISSELEPKITKKVQTYIKKEFQELINPSVIEEGVYMSNRLLPSIIRLTIAAARMRLSNMVSIEDAELAIALFKESLSSLGVYKQGRFDVSTYEKTISRSKLARSETILKAIEELSGDRGVFEEDLIKYLVDKFGLIESEIKSLLNALNNEGSVICPRKGMYRVM